MSGTSYPKGAKAWYSDAEYVSTADNNTTIPGETGASWIKLNDLSGTSGGSTVTCGWDAAKIGNIIDSLSSVSSSVSNIQNDIDELQSDIDSLQTNVTNIETKINAINNGTQFAFTDDYLITDCPSVMQLPGFLISVSSTVTSASISYQGVTAQTTLPSPRLGAGVGIPSGTGLKVALDVMGVSFSSPTQSSFTSLPITWYSTYITEGDSQYYHCGTLSNTTLLEVTIPLAFSTGETVCTVYAVGGYVGMKAATIHTRNFYPYSGSSATYRLLIPASYSCYNLQLRYANTSKSTTTYRAPQVTYSMKYETLPKIS